MVQDEENEVSREMALTEITSGDEFVYQQWGFLTTVVARHTRQASVWRVTHQEVIQSRIMT